MGLSGKEKGAAQGGHAPPPPLVLLGLGEVAGPPLSLPLRGILVGLGLGGGILLPEGVGLSCASLYGRPASPL